MFGCCCDGTIVIVVGVVVFVCDGTVSAWVVTVFEVAGGHSLASFLLFVETFVPCLIVKCSSVPQVTG